MGLGDQGAVPAAGLLGPAAAPLRVAGLVRRAGVVAYPVKMTGEPGFRTFAVTAVIGRRISSWPFGRLEISREFLRARGFGRRERQAPGSAVTRITCKRDFTGLSRLRIDDVDGHFDDTRLELPVGSRRIMDELRTCGYPVQAVDRWFRIRAPWSRRGWSPAPPRV